LFVVAQVDVTADIQAQHRLAVLQVRWRGKGRLAIEVVKQGWG